MGIQTYPQMIWNKIPHMWKVSSTQGQIDWCNKKSCKKFEHLFIYSLAVSVKVLASEK